MNCKAVEKAISTVLRTNLVICVILLCLVQARFVEERLFSLIYWIPSIDIACIIGCNILYNAAKKHHTVENGLRLLQLFMWILIAYMLSLIAYLILITGPSKGGIVLAAVYLWPLLSLFAHVRFIYSLGIKGRVREGGVG